MAIGFRRSVEQNIRKKITRYRNNFISRSQVVMKDGNLMYYRSATTKSGTYPKTDFKEWADFIKKASKSDKAMVVFTLRKT